MTGWYMLHFGSVPIYVHVPLVLALLALHGGTVYWAMKRIRELEGALYVRDQLLDEDFNGARVIAGGTLVQTFERPIRCIRITSERRTRLHVEYDH